MSGENMTRAEYLGKLAEMVKNQPNTKIFWPKNTENWPKTHNPAQDFEDSAK